MRPAWPPSVDVDDSPAEYQGCAATDLGVGRLDLNLSGTLDRDLRSLDRDSLLTHFDTAGADLESNRLGGLDGPAAGRDVDRQIPLGYGQRIVALADVTVRFPWDMVSESLPLLTVTVRFPCSMVTVSFPVLTVIVRSL